MLVKKGKQRRCSNCDFPLDKDFYDTICPRCGKSVKPKEKGIIIEERAGLGW